MKKFFYSVLSISAAAAVTHAAYTNTTLNISSCGGRMSGSRYTSIGSISPPGGQVSTSASFSHFSGFTAGFILQPQTAFSGLPDELNPDNDRDGLPDSQEIVAGSNLYNGDTDSDELSDSEEVYIYGTNLTVPDTDSDGMKDGHEVIAGTCPTDETSVLKVDCVLLPDKTRELSWFGVSGRFYILQHSSSLTGNNWQSCSPELEGSDSALSHTDTGTTSTRFYRVKVRLAD